MRTCRRSLLGALLLAAALVWPGAAVQPSRADAPGASEVAAESQAPYLGASAQTQQRLYVQNAGQWDAAARFRSLGGGVTTWLAEDAIWITLPRSARSAEPEQADGRPALPSPAADGMDQADAQPDPWVSVRMSFVGASARATLAPSGPTNARISFFLGDDPARWIRDAGAWEEVRYVDLYPGIDLVVGGAGGGPLRWRVEARPGADLSAVRLAVEGAQGLDLRPTGLTAITPAGDLALPLIELPDGTAPLQPAVMDGIVSRPFTVAQSPAAAMESEEATEVATASSDLLYSTFLGGGADDRGLDIAVGADGSAYIAGVTLSADFPTSPGAYDRSHGGSYDAFVAKIDPSGGALLYATYLGGSGDETSGGSFPPGDLALATDPAGNAYVVGVTSSADFPTTAGALDRTLGGASDAFAAKLSASGTALIYSTHLGGSLRDAAGDVAVDGAGNAYVVGSAESADFPTTPAAYDRSGSRDGFVAVLNASGTALVWASYLGGAQDADGITGIALDGERNVYVTGHTRSEDFPTTPVAFDPTCNRGNQDAFVVVMNPGGTALRYATCLGGEGDELANALALDTAGGVSVAGRTTSRDFPITADAVDTVFGGAQEGFVVRLVLAGAGTADLVYGTYLGGDGSDEVFDLAVDSTGAAVAGGVTTSGDFPVTPSAYDTTRQGASDGFVTKIHPSGRSLVYSTLLGGSAGAGLDEYVAGVTLTGSSAYLTGGTNSADFPTTPGALDRTKGTTGGDGFAARLVLPATGVDAFVSTPVEVVAPVGGLAAVPVAYGNRGATAAESTVLAATLHPGLVYVSDSSGLAPIISGNRVSWQAGRLALGARAAFELRVRPRGSSANVRYPVTLEITSLGPEEYPADNSSRTDVVALIPPSFVVLSGPDNGLAGSEVSFTAAVAPDTTSLPVTYTWQATGQPTIVHVGRLVDAATFAWEAPTTAVVTVTAANAAGSVRNTLKITIVPPVEAGFEASPTSGPLPLTVAFRNTSVGNFTRSRWDFGDGTFSDQRDPTHVYRVAGVYSVTLEVSGPDGLDWARRPEYIVVDRGRMHLPLVVAELGEDVLRDARR